MSLSDLVLLLPLLLPAGAAVLVMLAMAVRPRPAVSLGITLAGFAGALLALALTRGVPDQEVGWLVEVDSWARLNWAFLLVAAACVTPLAHAWLGDREERVGESHLLVILATLGALVLAAAAHVATLVLGLELLSVSLYALVAYPRSRLLAVEAGAKYLVLGATSTAFALFGLALVYAGSGALSIARLSQVVAHPASPLLVTAGAALLLVGLGFKLALVPFHQWAPDVYQGAPAPVAALLATVSKGGVLALLVRWTLDSPLGHSASFGGGLALLAGASMLTGNLLALRQGNIKRLLAYSSVAHLGYATIGVVSCDARAVAVYFAAYLFASLGAFGTLSLLSLEGREVEAIEDCRGLFWRHPWAAGALTLMLLSLTGIPLTGGFIGKLLVLLAGVDAGHGGLVAALVVGSVLGLAYYLRVIAVLFAAPADAPALRVTRSRKAWLPVVVAVVAVIWLGSCPEPLLAWVP